MEKRYWFRRRDDATLSGVETWEGWVAVAVALGGSWLIVHDLIRRYHALWAVGVLLAWGIAFFVVLMVKTDPRS